MTTPPAQALEHEIVLDPGSIRDALEQFVFDNAELERLEAILDTFNPFVAMRWIRQEARHSAFLRWLFDPSETHGLGSYFLGLFLKRLVRGAQPGQLSVVHVDSWDLSGAVVMQEWNGIDLLIQDDRNGFVAVIENKVDSAEHSDQLRRYRQQVEHHFPLHKKLFAYLTPDGEEPTDETYAAIPYTEIIDLLEGTLKRRGEQMADEVRTFVGQYVEMVRRFIMEDSEIQQLCRTIYEKHRKALDVLFEQRPDRASEVMSVLLDLLKDHPQLIPDHSTKGYIRFVPTALDFLPKTAEGWTPTKRLVLFELQNRIGGVSLFFTLGPGGQAIRDRVHEAIRQHPKVFNRATRPLYPKWWRFHSEKWIGAKQYDELDLDGLKQELRQHIDRLVNERLPVIEAALASLSAESLV